MKKFILFFMFASILAVAEENRVVSIEYENGDVYTVPENENVFISSQDNLFTYHSYSKSVQFKKQWPTDKVDRPIATPNLNPMGSHEWCKAHIPYETGYSFSDQAWERHCDTNNDREYGCGDETFDASSEGDVCVTTESVDNSSSFENTDESGFSQWCADFDTSVGFTFGYINWQQQCDKDNDGEYTICDYYEPTGQATFQEIAYNKQCSNNDGDE